MILFHFIVVAVILLHMSYAVFSRLSDPIGCSQYIRMFTSDSLFTILSYPWQREHLIQVLVKIPIELSQLF